MSYNHQLDVVIEFIEGCLLWPMAHTCILPLITTLSIFIWGHELQPLIAPSRGANLSFDIEMVLFCALDNLSGSRLLDLDYMSQ